VVIIDKVTAAMKLAESHCAREGVSTNWRLMSGTATLTMVAAITEAMVPTITLSSTHQRKLGPMLARIASRLPGAGTGWVMDAEWEGCRQAGTA